MQNSRALPIMGHAPLTSFGRIANPPESNISICNAKKTQNYVINIIDTRIVLHHFNRH